MYVRLVYVRLFAVYTYIYTHEGSVAKSMVVCLHSSAVLPRLHCKHGKDTGWRVAAAATAAFMAAAGYMLFKPPTAYSSLIPRPWTRCGAVAGLGRGCVHLGHVYTCVCVYVSCVSFCVCVFLCHCLFWFPFSVDVLLFWESCYCFSYIFFYYLAFIFFYIMLLFFSYFFLLSWFLFSLYLYFLLNFLFFLNFIQFPLLFRSFSVHRLFFFSIFLFSAFKFDLLFLFSSFSQIFFSFSFFSSFFLFFLFVFCQ